MDYVSGNFKNSRGNTAEFNLPLLTFQEDGLYFFYSPALDLTGYEKTKKEADSSFREALGQFLNYSINKNTLWSELKKLGWKVSKKSTSRPPSLVDMVNKNQYLAEIFEEKQYQKTHSTVSLPVFAERCPPRI